MKCPYCDHDNISGADLCQHCGADLGGLDLPREQTGKVSRHFHEVRLADLEPPEPITLPPTATVAEAVDQMRRKGYGAVLVVEGGVLVGIFTERDVLNKLAFERRQLGMVKLREVMTPNPDSLTLDATLGQALNLMAISGYRHIPVVDDMRRPVGFVSVRGALDYLHENVLD